MSEPTIRITEWTVSVLSPDVCTDAYLWDVQVAWRGKGRWAVLRGPFCLNAAGEWDLEIQPSSRTDKWLADHRFGEMAAILRARQVAPLVTINGKTPADLLKKYRP